MSSVGWTGQNRALLTLRSLVRRRARAEMCDLCSTELPPSHQHLIEPGARRILCACDACAVLFSGQPGTPYKRVPRRLRVLNGFRLTEAQWESLMIPINCAFFFHSSPQGRVVILYPSPAGAVESLLPLETWDAIAAENPILSCIEPDVEGLLVNRLGSARGYSAAEYYLVPIDECYKLVGLMRSHWRGLSGGAEVWEELGRFFRSLKARAHPASEESPCLT